MQLKKDYDMKLSLITAMLIACILNLCGQAMSGQTKSGPDKTASAGSLQELNSDLDFEARTPFMKIVSPVLGTKNSSIEKATSFAYYPGLRKMEVRIANPTADVLAGNRVAQAHIRLDGKPQIIAKESFPVSENGGYCLLDLPPMEDGDYTLTISLGTNGSSVSKSFKHKNYSWLGNNLGKNNTVYPPFTPITVRGEEVDVVLRTYKLNSFGLFDSIKSEGKEILAAPIVLRVLTAGGEQKWEFEKGQWTVTLPHLAVYETIATTPSVRVRVKSSLEYDGCMKVDLDLLPGAKAETIERMWLEIPYKNNEASYFHYCAFDNMRANYAGVTPRGGKIAWALKKPDKTGTLTLPALWTAAPGSDDGIIWTCRDVRYYCPNTIATGFVPYIWLGSGGRGLAFFGANDKGYLVDTSKNIQTIERKDNVVYLRIDLINKSSTVTVPHHLAFGLQASPTRPMPKDWRTNHNPPPPHSGPVVCWGGYTCASKYPDGRNFAVVDELVNVRKTGKVDMTVFEKLDRERATPLRFMFHDIDKPWSLKQNQPWLGNDLRYFISINQKAHENTKACLQAYLEEHASDVSDEEWEVFQDEWRAQWPWPKRDLIVEKTKPATNFKRGRQAFPSSYLDFCLYYQHEYMKRGIGVYFDNTMPYTCWNPLLSDAYPDANGKIQPACTIWEQRDYYKRVWTLMNDLMAKGIPPFPLSYSQHITNTRVLPLNTWNNASLDNEWRWYDEEQWKWSDTPNPIPFPPGLILSEMTGFQTGSYPYAHFAVNSHFNKAHLKLETARSEWGMRTVHEIPNKVELLGELWNGCVIITGDDVIKKWGVQICQKFERALRDFGYGYTNCRVINYWSDEPPVSLSDSDSNKWLLIIRPSDKSLLLVIQSWRKPDTEIEVKLDTTRLGFTPATKVLDVETDLELPVANITHFKVNLAGAYGTKVLKIGEAK